MSAAIGVISDTHGLVREEALSALADSELIVHAGDVGAAEVLDRLRSIAPVIAVRGNNDKGAWASRLARSEVVKFHGAMIRVVHDLADLDVDPAAAGYQAVITGHSHRPAMRARDGVLYLNPGSAGPRRFSLPIAVARLEATRRGLVGRIIELR